MSDSPSVLPPLPPPARDDKVLLGREPVPGEPRSTQTEAWLVPRSWALVVAALAAGGLLSSALLWQKLDTIQQEVARRITDSSAQAMEARTLARQAQDSTRDVLARQALQETRLSEVSLQRAQLEELMQSLSRSRDENLVVDVESDLRLAQQRALLTGSPEPLLAALKSADTRLTRAAQPRFNPLQRVITRDIARLKSASFADVPAFMLKLDELARLVDELPVVNEMVSNNIARALPAKAAASRDAASAAGRPLD